MMLWEEGTGVPEANFVTCLKNSKCERTNRAGKIMQVGGEVQKVKVNVSVSNSDCQIDVSQSRIVGNNRQELLVIKCFEKEQDVVGEGDRGQK